MVFVCRPHTKNLKCWIYLWFMNTQTGDNNIWWFIYLYILRLGSTFPPAENCQLCKSGVVITIRTQVNKSYLVYIAVSHACIFCWADYAHLDPPSNIVIRQIDGVLRELMDGANWARWPKVKDSLITTLRPTGQYVIVSWCWLKSTHGDDD